MQDVTKRHKSRIGELLLDYGFINQDQLAKALDRQIRSGGRLGSIIGEMGFVGDDMLLGVLGKQQNLPYVNLFEIKVSPDILNLIPFEQVKAFRALPFRRSEKYISVAMADPYDSAAIQNIESAAGTAVRPFIVPLHQIDKAIRMFEEEGYGSMFFEGEKLREEKAVTGSGVPGMHTFLRLIPDLRATALFLAAGTQPALMIGSELKRLSMPVITSAQMRDFVHEVLEKGQIEEFERKQELTSVISVTDTGRFRMSIFKQRNSISLSARLMFEAIPSVDELGLPEWITGAVLKPHGLVLIAGLPENGKSATVSALVDVINTQRGCNIVTLEDPIEYLHKHKLSNVNQREVGIDTESFPAGLKQVLRQGADVIAVSELRDAESVSMALNAAETGRMVIGAMTTTNSVTAVDRILNIFPADRQPQIRVQLADSLLLVFAQKLIPRKDGDGRVLAYEKLTGSGRIRGLIREGRTSNIKSLMQVASEDMLSIDRSIARLCLEGKISFEEGLKAADTPSYYQDLIRTGNA
jgi:twitching motility protein PilT